MQTIPNPVTRHQAWRTTDKPADDFFVPDTYSLSEPPSHWNTSKPMDTQAEHIYQDECGNNANSTDVPVNKKTSFHGRLNQYFHPSKNVKSRSSSHSGKSANISTPEAVSDSSATDIKGDSTSRGVESDDDKPGARPKRRKTRDATVTAIATPTDTGRITRSRSASSLQSPPSSLVTTPSTTSRATTQRQSTPKSLLRDTIPPNLTLLLVGVNPGVLTGTTGHAYAHPSNLFWKLLHWSGITPTRHPPSDTYKLPALYNIGNTNIVERPTRDASMLSRAEMDAGVPVLEAKVARQRPECVCLVGKGIWEAVWRVRRGRAIRKEEFRYGWQDWAENMGRTPEWEGARVFVATTTSGLAAGMNTQEKLAVWNELGRWVVKRRVESG